MKIVRYVNTADITIEFQDEHKFTTPTTYQNFKIGKVKNPYDKTTYGVGYLGVGKIISHQDQYNLRMYHVWENMIERCYHEKERDRHPAYAGYEIIDMWHCFQMFADWYIPNFYEIGDERMHLDKDILYKNNRIYSPDTCLIVPQRINMIFQNKSRKDDLPNGVHQNTSGSYATYYNGIRYGTYNTLGEAMAEHDRQKRINIKMVVEEYGKKLPDKVRDALLNW